MGLWGAASGVASLVKFCTAEVFWCPDWLMGQRNPFWKSMCLLNPLH